MWISTFILAPLGIYVTYKAMNDSAVFDKDAWLIKIRKILGRKGVRKITFKEVIINDISISEAITRLEGIISAARAYLSKLPTREGYVTYWTRGYDTAPLLEISEELDETVSYLTDCRDMLVVAKLADFPLLRPEWLYHPQSKPVPAKILLWFAPAGLILWLVGLKHQRELRAELRTVIKVAGQVIEMLRSDEEKQPEE